METQRSPPPVCKLGDITHTCRIPNNAHLRADTRHTGNREQAAATMNPNTAVNLPSKGLVRLTTYLSEYIPTSVSTMGRNLQKTRTAETPTTTVDEAQKINRARRILELTRTIPAATIAPETDAVSEEKDDIYLSMKGSEALEAEDIILRRGNMKIEQLPTSMIRRDLREFWKTWSVKGRNIWRTINGEEPLPETAEEFKPLSFFALPKSLSVHEGEAPLEAYTSNDDTSIDKERRTRSMYQTLFNARYEKHARGGDPYWADIMNRSASREILRQAALQESVEEITQSETATHEHGHAHNSCNSIDESFRNRWYNIASSDSNLSTLVAGCIISSCIFLWATLVPSNFKWKNFMSGHETKTFVDP